MLTGTSSHRVVCVDTHHSALIRVVRHGQRRWSTSEVFRDSHTRGSRADAGSREVPAVSSSMATTLTGHGAGAWTAISRWTYSVSPDLTLEPRAGSGERVAWYVLVHMDSLRVLAKIVKTREPARAVTLKGTFPGMFPGRGSACEAHTRASHYKPYMSSQMLTPCEAKLTWREFSTEETLALFLFRRPLRITRHAVVVRSVVFCAFLGVALSHFHIVRAA